MASKIYVDANAALAGLAFDGMTIMKHRLYRVYKALGMNLKRKGKRRLPARIKTPLMVPDAANEVWSIDFMDVAFLPRRAAGRRLVR